MGNLELKFKIENLMDGSSVAIVHMKGSIDGTTVKKFEAETLALAQKGFKYLILDFHEIGYMNSTGLGILVKVLDKYQEKSGDMKLVQVPKKVSDLFDMLGISSILSIYNSMQDAMNSLPSKVVLKPELPEVPASTAQTPPGQQTGKNKPVTPPGNQQGPQNRHSAVANIPPVVVSKPIQPAPVAASDDDMGGIVIDAEEFTEDSSVASKPAPPAPTALPTRSLKQESKLSIPPQPQPMPAAAAEVANEEGAIEEIDLGTTEENDKGQGSIESGIDLSFGQDAALEKIDFSAMQEETMTEMNQEKRDDGIDLSFGKEIPAAEPMSASEMQDLFAAPEGKNEVQDLFASTDTPADAGDLNLAMQDALVTEESAEEPEAATAPVAADEEMEEITDTDDSEPEKIMPEEEKNGEEVKTEAPLSELAMDEIDATAGKKEAESGAADQMDLFSFDGGKQKLADLPLEESKDRMGLVEREEVDALKDMGAELAQDNDLEIEQEKLTAKEEGEDDGERTEEKEETEQPQAPSVVMPDVAKSVSSPVDRARSGFAPMAPAPAAVPVPASPVGTPGETLKRKSTVRYYSQMNPFKAYPMSVALSKESIKKVKLDHVVQTEGRKMIEVAKEKTEVSVHPCLSGCLVSPASITIDVTPEHATAEFWVTPVVEGDISGWVDIVYQGKTVDKIPLTTRSVKQTIAKVGAAGAVLSPLLSFVLDGLQWNMKGFGNMLHQMQGASINLLLVGGVLMLLFVGTGVFFYLRNKPKEAEIIEKFFTMEQVKK